MHSRLLEVEFEYSTKFTPEEQKRLVELTGEPIQFQENGELSWSNRQLNLTISEASSLNKKFSVIRALNICRATELEDEFRQLASRANASAPVNEKCNVIVAGTSLLHINKVEVRNDYCTERLQEDLNQGWRILAVCVQPDGRRPDYVLGRTA